MRLMHPANRSLSEGIAAGLPDLLHGTTSGDGETCMVSFHGPFAGPHLPLETWWNKKASRDFSLF